MADGRHVEKSKLAISLELLADRRESRHDDAHWLSEVVDR